MESYYVVGAQQKNEVLKDWEQFKKGLIVKVSPDKGTVEKCIEYISPKKVCPQENPSILFTAGTIRNNYLYVGTQTEILKYSLPDFKKAGYFSKPCFNDIHHVRPAGNGNILIANTGLDMVMELSPLGKVVKVWNVLGEDPWGKFSKFKDYRKVKTTKPHSSHPNYVFTIGEDIWATRCLQMDAICLTKPDQRMDIGRALVHDGVLFGESVYFTQVDGHVVVVNINNHEEMQVHDLNKMTNADTSLGWCRGIKVLNEDKVIVGFTRIRPVRKIDSEGNEFWEGQYGVLPTRIACYDLKKGILLWEQELEEYDMNAIYSIHSEVE